MSNQKKEESKPVEPEKTEASALSEEDKELADLLDSAFSDFKKYDESNKAKELNIKKSSEKELEASNSDKKEDIDPESWDEEFFKEAASKFEQNMQALLNPGAGDGLSMNQLQANFQDFAGGVLADTGSADFNSVISQTLKSLSENAESLKTPDDQAMQALFGSLGMGSSDGDTNDILPLIQNVMQGLLSREILHPALSSILEKYPQWLEENKSKLSEADNDRYTRQLNLMRRVCSELDKESPTDTQQAKMARFDVILKLMHQMQDCGQPPEDLVGDLGPMLSFDEQGVPQFPDGQCSLM